MWKICVIVGRYAVAMCLVFFLAVTAYLQNPHHDWLVAINLLQCVLCVSILACAAKNLKQPICWKRGISYLLLLFFLSVLSIILQRKSSIILDASFTTTFLSILSSPLAALIALVWVGYLAWRKESKAANLVREV